VLTWPGEPVKTQSSTTPEPKDKLDAKATKTADAAQADTPAIAAANGPEDEITDWLSIDWQQVENDVRRLRQRIFTATQAGNLTKARNLQKLMLRSRANALLSVRRVTEVNAGRETAGIDGKTALLPQSKAELADWLQRRADERGLARPGTACGDPVLRRRPQGRRQIGSGNPCGGEVSR